MLFYGVMQLAIIRKESWPKPLILLLLCTVKIDLAHFSTYQAFNRFMSYKAWGGGGLKSINASTLLKFQFR